MYTERVYILQLEFSEISQMLANPMDLKLRDELVKRRTEIIAEASDILHKLKLKVPIKRAPAHSSCTLELAGVSSD
jgi:hypothetical protein